MALGYCKSHYNRLKLYGDPLGGNPIKGSIKVRRCLVEGCPDSAHWRDGGKRGWCPRHYARWKGYGDPLGGGTFVGEPLKFLHDVVFKYTGEDCLTWPYARNGFGYGNISLNGSWHRVSRLACEEENGPPPTPQHEAAHSCGKGHEGCVSRSHLSWKTTKENSLDSIEHGTIARGNKLPQTKLTENDVRRIRSMRGVQPQKELAREFGVSQSRISLIQNRVDWAWLE